MMMYKNLEIFYFYEGHCKSCIDVLNKMNDYINSTEYSDKFSMFLFDIEKQIGYLKILEKYDLHKVPAMVVIYKNNIIFQKECLEKEYVKDYIDSILNKIK